MYCIQFSIITDPLAISMGYSGAIYQRGRYSLKIKKKDMRTIHPNTRYGLLSVLENKKIIPATHIRNTSDS